jgi:hypothetical protein
MPVEAEVVHWRLLLWEPWFVVWGLLLGAASWPDATVVSAGRDQDGSDRPSARRAPRR